MRTRLLTSLAVAAAALLAPASALAVTPPAITAPPVTNDVHVAWTDVADETGYRLFRGDGACSGTPIFVQVGIDWPADIEGIDDTPPADGTYCYYVEAFDALEDGSGASNQVTVAYDGTLPTVTLAGVASSTTVRGTLSLSASPADVGGSDVASVTFGYRLGTSGGFTAIGAAITSPPYTRQFNTATLGLNGGPYEIRALVVDGAGNQDADVATGVTIDNTAPSVTLSGVASNAKVRGTLSLTASASDAGGSGLASVTFGFRQGTSGGFTTIGSTIAAPGPFGVSFDTVGLGVPDGTYQIRALAVDGIANTNEDVATTVTIDNTAPATTLGGVASNAKVHGTLTLTASPSDSGSGVASVTFGYRQGTTGAFTPIGATISAPGPYSRQLNTLTLVPPDGSYEIEALVVDVAGNQHETIATGITVDNTAPTVTLDGVVAATNVRGTLSFSSTPADGGSGVASVTFGYRLGTVGAFTSIGAAVAAPGPYARTLDTVALALLDGAYDFQALALDAAGNQQTAIVTGVLVDNHVPTTPTNLTGFATVQANPAFSFTASVDTPSNGVASGLDHYNVYRDSPTNLIGSVLAAETSFVDTGAPDGPHTYTLAAVDKAGNSSPQSSAFSVVVDSTDATAPTSVSAAAQWTNQRPQISWVAPATPGFTIHHYEIFRNGSSIATVLAPLTTYADTTPGLLDNSYAYVVVAVSGDAVPFKGTASGAAGVVYDTAAPSGPGSVSASAAVDGSVSLTWAASLDGAGSGISRYVVRRSSSSIPPATIADGDATCQTTVTSCSDANALNGKLYSYAVFAVDRAGNTSVAGVSQAVTARDQAPPAAPQGLAATPGDGSVNLTWAPAGADGDVAGYVLVAKQGTQAPTSDTDGLRVCTAIVGTSSSCAAGGLTNGATYTFGLFALDEALNRSQPAVVSSAPNGKVDDLKAPGAVTKLRVKVVGKKVTLTWKNPVDRDFDHVVITSSTRKPSERKASTRVYSGKGTKAATKLPAGQSRWFLVIAYDAVGNASAPASVRAIVAPASPFGPAPSAKVKGKVRLSWPVVKGARYYNVQIYAGKKRVAVGWPGGHSLVVPHAKLHKGVKYTWYVWPGLGSKTKAHYGKLIGKNVFTYAG